jgi:hypothetical protein
MSHRPAAVSPHRRVTRARAVLVAVSLAAGPGCSYAFVHGPRTPSVPSTERADAEWVAQSCTRSNALPILDTTLGTVLGAIGVLGIVAGVGAASETPPPPSSPFAFNFRPSSGDMAAIIGLGAAVTAVGGLLIGSGVSGFGRTKDCRRAIESSIPSRLPPTKMALPAPPASP